MSLTLPLLLTVHVVSYQHYGCERKKQYNRVMAKQEG